MTCTPEIVLRLLSFLGMLAGNWAVLHGLPAELSGNDAFVNGISTSVTCVVINLGTFAFWVSSSVAFKMGANMDIIWSLISAAEEQFGPGTNKGSEKLDYALSILDKALATTKMGFLTKIGFKLFAKQIISSFAPKVKALYYTDPKA